jgi:UPF0042 nucleotide-binding protein
MMTAAPVSEEGLKGPSSVSSGDGKEPRANAAGVVVVTGMSGAGKTLALKSLEDMGYEAVDNLPLSLLPALVPSNAKRPIAICIDIRSRDFSAETMLAGLDRLKDEHGIHPRLVFVDCEDEVLGRRFTETRRRHPLGTDRPVLDGIMRERLLMATLRDRADLVIDTSSLPPSELKRMLSGYFGLSARTALTVFVTSFAYRHGLPRDADLVIDTRFLSNPHYQLELRALSGRDREVADYVERDPGFGRFFESLTGLLEPLLPRFAAEGKSYLTIAIGCTGGRHRSVAVAEKLTAWLSRQGQAATLRHRDLEQGDLG